ncbi:replication termination factor 2-like [Asterias amurensis]|uniref:replication termination factor 2-like n=1 Tax=Asterias amurensis TaxID=7602 RepID=UPI003AB88845
MGCDGGTIPRRDELVRLKKRPEQVDKNMERMAKWLHCSITQERLRQPVMACELGRLYNKESVLEYLLDKTTSDSAQHIRSLRDVKELNLSINPAFEKQGKKKGDVYLENDIAQYICPVSGLQMNGHYRFCFLWSCGCVLSEKALKEVKSDVCHKCGSEYDVEDAVILNGNPEDIDSLRDKMEEKRARAKAEKKAKKALKRKLETPSTVTSSEDQPTTSKESKPDPTKLTNGTSGSSKPTNGIKAESSKLTNGSGKTLKSSKKGTDKSFDHTKSAVYKSLFLSKDQKDINKAHWVTYNPYYAMSK